MVLANNIKVFINSMNLRPTNKLKLVPFTLSKSKKLNSIINGIKINETDYTYTYNNKDYHFKLMSDLNIQKIDKKNLQSKNRYYKAVFRSLRLGARLDLKNQELIVTKSPYCPIDVLIKYNEDNQTKVMSYHHNLIMNQEDYYELFEVEEINRISKIELYILDRIMDSLEDNLLILYLLWFKDELFKELSPYFKIIDTKYDNSGINKNNYSFMGDGSDVIFRTKEDLSKYNGLEYIDRLASFTENPNKKSKYVKLKNKESKKYHYKDSKIEFDFKLLSDNITSKEEKEELLSSKRYHKCHEKAFYLAYSLHNQYKTYIVAGYNKYNELDYYYHSWIELDDLDIVIDYVHNLMMKKEEYYRIMNSKISSRISSEDYFTNLQYIKEIPGIGLFITNYLGEYLAKDLEKNKQLFKKKSD